MSSLSRLFFSKLQLSRLSNRRRLTAASLPSSLLVSLSTDKNNNINDMSNHEQKELQDALMDKKHFYEKAKQAYRDAQQLYDDALKTLQLWKMKHQHVAFDPLQPDFLLVKNKVEKGSHVLIQAYKWRNDAERRWKDGCPEREDDDTGAETRYEEAKRAYWNAVEAPDLWKEKYKDVQVDLSLKPDLLLLQNKVRKANTLIKDSNQVLNDAERRWNNALVKNKQKISVPNWNEWYAIAQQLNLKPSGRILKVPSSFFSIDFFNGLFIRQEYVDVAKMIDHARDSIQTIRKVLVIGSPGIGKSIFGVLLFLLAISTKRNVAYGPLFSQVTYYFTWNGKSNKYDITNDPYEHIQYEGYFDGNDVRALNLVIFNCVYLFASPSTTNYHYFEKDNCFKIYMNPWNKQECETFAGLMRSDDKVLLRNVFHNAVWQPKFDLIGGKPRMLFSSIYTDELLFDLVQKTTPRNIRELEKQIQRIDQASFSEDSMKHIVYNMNRSNRSPSFYDLTFSSEVVEKIVDDRFAFGSAKEILELLQTPVGMLPSSRGKGMEDILLLTVANTRFTVRPLEEPSGDSMEYGPFKAGMKRIQTASQIGNELMLYILESEAFPVIDGVLVVPKDGLIFYVLATISENHPIQYSLLKDLYDDFTNREEFRGYTHMYLFMVTDDIYDKFHYQPYMNMDGKQRRKQKNTMELKQYVGKKKKWKKHVMRRTKRY